MIYLKRRVKRRSVGKDSNLSLLRQLEDRKGFLGELLEWVGLGYELIDGG
jgi:hypothetical protein